jgi:2-phospho-L-lactate transferase/gluconeogenesis factor (CofD/UPF0052 family)
MSRHPLCRQVDVALFCGGRGSAAIIRALLDSGRCHLSLLVNGFDDGRSTGTVRRLVPGMLGPSDFRKNLVTTLDPGKREQRALGRLLEQRLGEVEQLLGDDGLLGFVDHGEPIRLCPPLAAPLGDLDARTRRRIRGHLARLFASLPVAETDLMKTEPAVGNLIFAGIFLETRAFNPAVRTFAALGRPRAEILNVCDGACRWLIGLKEDGEILPSEEAIVGPQSARPIADLYLLPNALDTAQQGVLALLSGPQKQAWLGARQAPSRPSAAALAALAAADAIIFGPGTQYSSLLPSYRILGEAIAASPAVLKLLVINLDPDQDIQGLSASDLVDRALVYLGDPKNQHGSLTHVLLRTSCTGKDPGLSPGALGATDCYRGARIVRGDYRDPRAPGYHQGDRVAARIFDLLYEAADERRGAWSAEHLRSMSR